MYCHLRKQRPRVIKELVQEHGGSKWQSQDGNAGLPGPGLATVCIILISVFILHPFL